MPRLQFRILPAALIGAGLLLAGKLGVFWVEMGAPAEAASAGRNVAALASIAPAAGASQAEDKAKETPAEADPAKDDAKQEKPAADKAKPGEAPATKAADGKAKADAAKSKDAASKPAAKPDDGKAAAKGEPAEAKDEHAAAKDEHAAEVADPEATAEADAGATGARLGLDDEDFDPMMLTRAEIELLQGLSKRREALEAREREFVLREQTLAAAEQKLDAKIKALEELKTKVEALLGQYDKQEEERLRSLVKIYESMKPKEAAAILEGLEQDTLLDVFERMKEAKSASILALLNPARAKMITEEMIARRRLPKPEENS